MTTSALKEEFMTTGTNEVLLREIEQIRNLREDVLLLRFHLMRRTDLAKVVGPPRRLKADEALKSSLEVLECFERNQLPSVETVATTTAALAETLDEMVTAARLSQETDGTGEASFQITPESLRASLTNEDIARALGKSLSVDAEKYKSVSLAKRFLRRRVYLTVFWFIVALCVHYLLANGILNKLGLSIPQLGNLEILLIPLASFLWAIVGANVWILIRFRLFGSAYAFDTNQAEVFYARVYSGSITTAILLYFICGAHSGELSINDWDWKANLPLIAFVIGYAGRLQVDILNKMIDRIGDAITGLFGKKPHLGSKPGLIKS